MSSVVTMPEIQTLNVCKEVLIAAPMDIVFDTIVHDQGGPLGDQQLKLEAWPGGRWYRDFGNNTGHLWGHVQVIKPPKLLEIIGPMFMSYPVASFLQYRLTEEGNGTKLVLTHQAFGTIRPDHLEGVDKGWGQIMESIKARAERIRGK
jgi:uncharacterized protein YndB with AHSA1/START domain